MSTSYRFITPRQPVFEELPDAIVLEELLDAFLKRTLSGGGRRMSGTPAPVARPRRDHRPQTLRRQQRLAAQRRRDRRLARMERRAGQPLALSVPAGNR